MEVVSTDSTAATTVDICGYYVQFRGHLQNNVKTQCFFTHTSIYVQHAQDIRVHYSHKFLPLQHPSQHHCSLSHLRALRDTGNTCHGSPDLGEGSSRAHTCTRCPWNAKRRRQDYGCTFMCGDSRGCPTSSGDKQFKCIHVHTMCNRL